MLWLIEVLGLAVILLSCVTIFQWFFLQWCSMQVWTRLCYPEIKIANILAKDRVWYFVMLFLCGTMQRTQTRSSVISSTKSHGSRSHTGEITCALGKSLRSWGCPVDSSRSQGTPCTQGTCYFVIYNISLCNSVHTINEDAYSLRPSLE